MKQRFYEISKIYSPKAYNLQYVDNLTQAQTNTGTINYQEYHIDNNGNFNSSKKNLHRRLIFIQDNNQLTKKKIFNSKQTRLQHSNSGIYINNKIPKLKLLPSLSSDLSKQISRKTFLKRNKRMQTDVASTLLTDQNQDELTRNNNGTKNITKLVPIKKNYQERVKSELSRREEQVILIKKQLILRNQGIEKLQKIWVEFLIPQCHQEYICKLIEKNQDRALEIIQNEIASIRSDSSSIVQLASIINKRQSCLVIMHELIEELKMLDQKNNKVLCLKLKDDIEQKVQQLRHHSLDVIEKFLIWKNQIQNLYLQFRHEQSAQSNEIKVKFQLKNKINSNYLIRILKDGYFIFQSGIFSQVNYPDPFFVSYIEESETQNQIIFQIRASELLLLQETLNL